MGAVIDMEAWREARRPMAQTLCRHSDTVETAWLNGLHLCFAWQRIWICAVFHV